MNGLLFLAHLAALIIVCSFTFFMSFVLYKVTDLIIPLRVSAAEEAMGLDLSQHGESCHEISTHFEPPAKRTNFKAEEYIKITPAQPMNHQEVEIN